MVKIIDFNTPLQKFLIPFLIIWKLKFGSIINVILAELQQRSYISFALGCANMQCSFSTPITVWRFTGSPRANFLKVAFSLPGRKLKNDTNMISEERLWILNWEDTIHKKCINNCFLYDFPALLFNIW